MAKSGYKIIVYLDDNPLSPTYMQTYEERVLDEETCPIESDDLVLISNECEIDISGYTGYRLEIYYNRTTGEYVENRVEDPECIESSTDEQWVNSGSPYCETTEIGINTGYMLQLQVQMNPNLENYKATRTSRYKSPECGGNNCAIWDDIQKSCHVSVIDCAATFDGTEDISQIDINPLSDTFNQTRTINKQSNDCENCTNTTYSWVLVGDMCGDDDLLCGNGIQQTSTNSYTVSQKYKTIGTGSPIPMDEYQIVLKTEDDENCGYIRPQYEMRKIEGQYICDYETYTKYEKWCKYVSYDSGDTWSMVIPEVCESGDVIAYDSYDCGKPMYRWVPNGEFTCVDNGDDWKLKIANGDNNLLIIPCDESDELSQNDLDGITINCSGATIVDFGNCISSVNCVIRGLIGGYYGRSTVHFGDYIETIGNGRDGIFDTYSYLYLRFDDDTFNDNLKIINDNAFMYQGDYKGYYEIPNKTVYLGDKIEYIGANAFWYTRYLNTLKINAEIPPEIGLHAFFHDYQKGREWDEAINCILVPRNTVETYKAAWSEYERYIYSLAEEDTFYRPTYSGGTRGWNFSSEGTNGILSRNMTRINYGDYYPSYITNVYLSNDITEIGASAFTNCSNLTSITIPDSVTSIGANVFANCTSLSSVTIGSGVTTIGSVAFKNCSGLSGNVTIPDSVTSIGERAFNGCGMSSLNIGNGLTIIDSSIFESCTNLSSVTIANSISAITDGAFAGCSSLTSITFPNSVVTIGHDAFNGSGLINLTIPDSVTSIEYDAFYGCGNLTSVNIGTGVTSIGQSAFANCHSLTNLNIGNFTVIGLWAFENCMSLETINLNGSGNGVITTEAFKDCSGLTRVNIGSGVTSIAERAFLSVRRDEYPDESDFVVYCYAETPPNIGTNTSPFMYQRGLASYGYFKPVVYVPCSAYADYRASAWNNICVLRAINNNCAHTRWVFDQYICFDGVKREQERLEASYPSGNTWTEYYDTGERRLTEDTYGSCVKAIMHLTDGTDVIIDNLDSNVLTSGDVRSYETTTSGVTIGSNCQSLDYACLHSFIVLQEVIIPDSVTSIGPRAFQFCTGLTSVNIPSGVTSIDHNVFTACYSLTSIIIPDNVTTIGTSAFTRCYSLTSVVIGSGVTSIGESSFEGCTSLTSIIIPDNVTTIGRFAFNNCSGLTSVVIGSGVTSIGYYGFGHCSGLTSVTCLATTPPDIGSYVFYLTNVSTIYVPAGSVYDYQGASGWGDYIIMPIT